MYNILDKIVEGISTVILVIVFIPIVVIAYTVGEIVSLIEVYYESGREY